ncbi:MAG: RNA polymerase sigma-70 factor ECF [Planctomycetota bacterium]|nr:MAG: RNA polymerase sigma-70 factor ECF [Planctomycetota bacterium]
MQNLPDEELVALSARGRHDAFEVLVKRHQRKVAGLAYRFTGSRTDAEDLAQDVFLAAWSAAARWRPEAKFGTWLYRVTANACLNWKRRSRPALVAGLDARPAAGESAEAAMARREEEAAVGTAVKALPANQRMALILRRFEGRTNREVGEAMDCSEAAVEGLLQRAYDGLREKLREANSSV